jgi:hypothetical protein
MGGGTYSINSSTGEYDKSVRSRRVKKTLGKNFMDMSIGETFTKRSLNNAMDPHGIEIRESRDSEEHPESLAIVLALDETGSMGSVPHYLVKEGLPNIMGNIINKGIKDPQLLFLGIGDHTCDTAPVQVGQFESSDELLDKWLTDIYLEGKGGSNDHESYLLAWYFAAFHTSIDCFEKRNKKGYLFTVGDERTIKEVSESQLKNIMGDGQYQNFTAFELLEKAREKYHVYHLHIKETRSGSRQMVIDDWKQIMMDDLIVVEKKEDVSNIISDIVTEKYLGTVEVKEENIGNDEIML